MKLSDHLDKLNAYKTIVEAGTMREAALRLNVTQPSLTKLVQNLEQAAKTALLSRGRMGVATTPAGQKLYTYACSVLKGLEDLEQKLSHPSDEMAGQLRIGAYASLGEYLWPEFIPSFRKKKPSLHLSVFTSESMSHQQALLNGNIDILVDAEPRLSDGLISWNLYDDRFNFFIAKGKAEAWDTESIQQAPLIYSPTAFDCDNKRIIRHLEENGYHFKERLEFDSFMAVLALAKKGIGLAVLPNRLAHASIASGELQQAQLKKFSQKGFGLHRFAATIHERRKDDPRLRFLITSLREWFKKEN